MPLSSGDRIGPYEIAERIGAGGMGEVYRAADSRMGRDVAIKVSVERYSDRFSREVHAVAALNHPNVCILHDVGENYLVMELIEGPTLAERIERGPIPLEEALDIAKQIAAALEAAHEKGIVHRDLKPGNIKIKPDGTVKVLDFGLAKMPEAASAASSHDSPTISMAATQAGVILGTAAYMSPEQVRGRPVDKRADIWAFGVVLYEILTGKRLFEGESVTETLAATLTASPDLSKTPAQVRRLLQSCLEKDPKQRLRDIGDAWRLLEEPAKPKTSSTGPWVVVAIVAIAAFIAGGLTGWLGSARQVQTSVTLSIEAPAGERIAFYPPVISPDGLSVWYGTADLRPHLRRIDSLDDRVLPDHARWGAFWSPDSTAVFFWTKDQLLKVRPQLNTEEPILKIGQNCCGTLSERGAFLFGGDGHCAVFSSSGGEPRAVPMAAQFKSCLDPEFLPGGDDFIFTGVPGRNPDDMGIYLSRLRDGKASDPVLLLNSQNHAHYTPAGGGRLLYSRNDNLYSQKLNLRTRKLEGDPELVTQSVASNPAYAYFSVARNGTVAWRPGAADLAQIVEFDRSGKVISISGPPGNYMLIALSPDGKRLLTDGYNEAGSIIDVGQPGRLPLKPDVSWIGWSGDGSRLIGAARESLVEASAAGSGEVRPFGKVGMPFDGYPDISSDGKLIVGAAAGGTFSIPLDANPNEIAAKIVMTSSDEVRMPSLSPDHHWVVYDPGDRGGVYVRPFPGPGQRRRIGPVGQNIAFPYWRKDGNEILYYLDGDLMSVGVTWHGEPSFAEPRTLFSGLRRASSAFMTSRPLTASRDGSRIFWLQPPDQPNLIDVKTYAIR